MAVGRSVAAPESGTTEGVEGGGVVMGCIEEGEENSTCIPSHLTYISYSENGVQTTISGGTSNVCRGLYPHMQYTGYTSHRLTSDWCLLRRAREWRAGGQGHWRQGERYKDSQLKESGVW